MKRKQFIRLIELLGFKRSRRFSRQWENEDGVKITVLTQTTDIEVPHMAVTLHLGEITGIDIAKEKWVSLTYQYKEVVTIYRSNETAYSDKKIAEMQKICKVGLY